MSKIQSKESVKDEKKLKSAEKKEDLKGVYATFVPRTTAPTIPNDYYFGSGNPYNSNPDLAMPNCTTYAFGRFWEVYGDKPGLPLTRGYDATTFYYHCKNDADSEYKNLVGQTPKLGAIVCWSTVQNDNPSITGSVGHVAVVERIESNGDIYCSNSAHKSTFFYMKTYSKSSNYSFTDTQGRYYYLQGFIYQKQDSSPVYPTGATYQTHDATHGWSPNVVISTDDYAGNIGFSIDAVYLDTYRMQVHDMVKDKWLPWVENRNDYAGNFGNPIDGIRIEGAAYRAHLKGYDWLDWVYKADDTSAGYAGVYGREIDAIQIKYL